jgi:outer membrane protein assembly factor BamB
MISPRVRTLAGRAVGLAAVAGLVACSATAPTPGPGPSASAGATASASATGSAPPPTSIPAPAGADWPTYHRDNLRSGNAPDMPAVRSIALGWHARTDGAVYGQPIVVGGTVYAGTEHDTVYALDAATGTVRWSTHLGTPVPLADLPCGNIDPLGITGTMVYDPATRQVFAVAETTGGAHTLYGLDATSGAIRTRRPVDPPLGDRLAHQQRSALTLLNGWVYIAYGGLAGDCAQYIGSVVAAPTTGGAPLRSYAIPTTREAGIWAPGGGIVSGGRLLYAVGNGESHDRYDGSDSVIALDPTLRLVDRFWPTTWPQDNRTDLDLGSMTPVAVGGFILAVGKSATAYVLRAGHLGGQGGQLAQLHVCAPFGGAAVNDRTVYLPCRDGPTALELSTTGVPTIRWHTPLGASGSPVLGGGVLWVVDYQAGTLSILDPSTGRARAHLDLGSTPNFASPTLSGRRAYVGTTTGVTTITTT